MAAQVVAASCLLLLVSSLMVGAVQRLRSADPGFDYRHLVWVSPGLEAHGYRGPAAQAYLGVVRARAVGKFWKAPSVAAAAKPFRCCLFTLVLFPALLFNYEPANCLSHVGTEGDAQIEE